MENHKRLVKSYSYKSKEQFLGLLLYDKVIGEFTIENDLL